ncbi:MAG TPA: hypothetical protein VG795_05375 [Acidimicrobiia bacterium]|nr:hypothetical protein [Acidimicrobiia bacterium]
MRRRALRRRLAVVVAVVSVVGVTRAVARSESSPLPESSAASASPGTGYWLVGADGNVYPFGVPAFGSLSGTPPARPIIGAAATPAGHGYWLAGTDGGVFSFGDARFHGSTGNIRLNRPIVGMAATPSGGGYWLVASDGGVFSFGDARFHGSTGAMRLNRPIVGMAATPSGRGYWLVAADGGIFAFGDAGFYGSTGSIILNKPITGMSASATGRGYRFVASDGGLFSFGDAPYAGSAAGRRLDDPIVGMAGSPTGNGYWLAGSSGAVYAYGDVSNKRHEVGSPLSASIVAIMAPPRLPEASPPSTPTPSGPSGDGTRPSDVPATTATTAAPPTTAPTAPFRVALIGDTGYTDAQDQLLLKTRTAISSRDYAFVLHDGDVQGPLGPCSDERLGYVHEVFEGFSVPLVYTPGDNEWAGCPDPAERLAAIRKRFFSTNQSLGQRRIPLTRQAAPFVENARWTAGNVVFATLNVPGPTGKSRGAGGLSAANIAWLNDAFDTAAAQNSPGVMIIWQDDPFDGSGDLDLQNVLVERARAFGRPVALVHGHSHFYRLGKNWPGVPNLTELQTFALDNLDRWVEVTVDPADPDVFRFAKMPS